MTDDLIADLARRINATGSPKGVVYVAGGGTEVFPMLLARGGGSSTLLAGRIPYDPADLRATLGYDPGRLVDARAARGLAMTAFRHALSLRGDLPPESVFGIGATSKLTRGPDEREGRTHEVHAALQTSSRTTVRTVVLPAGHDRAWEERINALVILQLLASGKGLRDVVSLDHDGRAVPPAGVSGTSVAVESLGQSPLAEVLVGLRSWTAFDLDGGRIRSNEADRPRVILPGSFRPLHEGHIGMAEAATRLVGAPCAFEISLFHPDKPPLDYVVVRSRLDGFGNRQARVYLTNAPTYLDKARLFPGCAFAVGHDTLVRILDPRYYGGTEGRDAVLRELESLGATFLVFGRVDDSGRFTEYRPSDFDGSVAGFLERSARPVPERDFRLDLSSTQVRARTNADYP